MHPMGGDGRGYTLHRTPLHPTFLLAYVHTLILISRRNP